MSEGHTEVTVEQIPDCDLCKLDGIEIPAAYDAKSRQGPWAWMCQAHFETHGIRLGLGWGQRLILKEKP